MAYFYDYKCKSLCAPVYVCTAVYVYIEMRV